MNTRIIILSSIIACAAIVSTAGAELRYVTPSGGGTCTSWADACGLATALVSPTPPGPVEVWVKAGTYAPLAETAKRDGTSASSIAKALE